jgi:hypothetical protein
MGGIKNLSISHAPLLVLLLPSLVPLLPFASAVVAVASAVAVAFVFAFWD